MGGVFWLRCWLHFAGQSELCHISGYNNSQSVHVHLFKATTAWFLFAFHWFKRFAFLLRVERDKYFFLGFALANFPIVAMGFLTLIHTSLTVTALALIYRLQVNFLPSTSACFRSLINSTEKSIAVKYLLSSIHWVVFANQVLIYLILEPNRHLYLHLCKTKS